MKKTIALLLCFVMITAAGCGGDASHDANQNNGVEAALQSGIDAANSTEAPAGTSAKTTAEAADPKIPTTVIHTPAADETVSLPSSDVDVDLTILSSTMVYAEVYGMVTEPSDYIGKMVRMNGQYATAYVEETDTRYHACIIQDATACCAQGIEFVLRGDPQYPNGYPQEGDIITVVGCFDTYVEGDYLYCTLRDAVLE